MLYKINMKFLVFAVIHTGILIGYKFVWNKKWLSLYTRFCEYQNKNNNNKNSAHTRQGSLKHMYQKQNAFLAQG